MNVKHLGERLSLDHHSQGMIFVLGIVFIVLRVWWSIPGLLLYAIMHFQYGGTGTFQKPTRSNISQPTAVDYAYVGMGLLGIATMICAIIVRLIKVIS